MYGIVLLTVVALVSLIITRIATVALTVTGMTRESARFQARSALTGVGFTTSETELVVNHPVRRRIAMALMLIGNVGLATAMAGILATFVNADAGAGFVRAVLLVSALALVYLASRSPVVDRRLTRIIARWLVRNTSLPARDFERLLHLAGDYAVQEMAVVPGHWLAGRTLGEVRLRDEGIVVLGVNRQEGTYLGVPDKETEIREGDVVILYGRGESIARLGHRPSGREGDRDHSGAAVTQRRISRREQAADPVDEA